MKPVAFDYEKEESLSGVAARLGETAGAKIISGGQSLGAMLNLRLVRPRLLIDLSDADELRTVTESEGSVLYGAALRHAEFEDGLVPDAAMGMMAYVASGIAYRAVRNRGTIGGSLVHADPAADWVLACTALGATLHIAGQTGGRRVAAEHFILSAFTTDLQAGEILTGVEVPRLGEKAAWGYYKICRKVGEFAHASAAAVLDPDRRFARVVLGALDGAPAVLDDVAQALASEGGAAAHARIPEAVRRAAPDASPVARRQYETALKRAIQQIHPL